MKRERERGGGGGGGGGGDMGVRIGSEGLQVGVRD